MSASLWHAPTGYYYAQALQVAKSISDTDALSAVASNLSQAGFYWKSLDSFRMQTIEEIISFLANWQKDSEKYYPDTNRLWQRILLAALEIICWQRKDYAPVRDILRKQ